MQVPTVATKSGLTGVRRKTVQPSREHARKVLLRREEPTQVADDGVALPKAS